MLKKKKDNWVNDRNSEEAESKDLEIETLPRVSKKIEGGPKRVYEGAEKKRRGDIGNCG